jgi:hypothetical protein
MLDLGVLRDRTRARHSGVKSNEERKGNFSSGFLGCHPDFKPHFGSNVFGRRSCGARLASDSGAFCRRMPVDELPSREKSRREGSAFSASWRPP